MKKKQTNGQILLLGIFIVFLIIWAFFVADIREREHKLEQGEQGDYIVNFKEQTY